MNLKKESHNKRPKEIPKNGPEKIASPSAVISCESSERPGMCQGWPSKWAEKMHHDEL